MDQAPHFYAKDVASWREWLVQNHNREEAVWLVFDKGKNRTMSWQNIVEQALCFGWIDSRPGKVSDTQSKIYVSRRKPKSVWSKINKEHVQRLIEAEAMTPAGLKSIEVAKANGSWSALDLSDNLVYPKELNELFDNDHVALSNFENFPIGSRRNTLQWIYDAKTIETRLSRVKQTYQAAKENKRLR
jgi:uncharacterized protein YdeI (YjbR/CyaY-like superfamily)